MLTNTVTSFSLFYLAAALSEYSDISLNFDSAGELTSAHSLYQPCKFPCHNFTHAFKSEANGVWFKVDSVQDFPEARGDEPAVRLKITRHCRLDASGTLLLDHIIISYNELQAMNEKPRKGADYVAAVIRPAQSSDFRLLSPLVGTSDSSLWDQLCQSCGVDTESVVIETHNEQQSNACNCRQKSSRNSPVCINVIIGLEDKAKDQHIVFILILSVGIGFCLLILAFGMGYWHWHKYRVRRYSPTLNRINKISIPHDNRNYFAPDAPFVPHLHSQRVGIAKHDGQSVEPLML